MKPTLHTLSRADDALTGMIAPDESLAERVQPVMQRLNLLARLA